MPKKAKIRAEAKAIAKIEASAKASFQRKKIITEVVPSDVTRAKAGAWLDILSPITEWAGLKGDALRHKRNMLRVQQEETLLRIAQAVREKLADQPEVKPISPKILVPALEMASLEDISDDVMVDRWANLLASAASAVGVQPRFVGILRELAGAQAECLERIAFNRYTESTFPDVDFADSFISFPDHVVRKALQDRVKAILDKSADANEVIENITNVLNRPGVFLIFGAIADSIDSWEYDSVAETGIRDDADLSILESLGLVRYAVIEFTVRGKSKDEYLFDVSAHYYHLTQLGVDFCKVCSRSRLSELEKIGDASRKKGLERKDHFPFSF